MRVSSREGIAVSAFAKKMGVAKQTIQDAVKTGRIPRSAVFDDGSLDEPPARVAFMATSQPQRHKRRTAPPKSRLAEQADETAEARGLTDLDEAEIARLKVDKLIVELKLKEHELADLQGSTIDKDVVRRAVSEWNTKIKTGLLNFAARRGPSIAAQLGANEVELVGLLEAAMREHMVEMAEERLPMGAEE